jgi:hypothetical protein
MFTLGVARTCRSDGAPLIENGLVAMTYAGANPTRVNHGVGSVLWAKLRDGASATNSVTAIAIAARRGHRDARERYGSPVRSPCHVHTLAIDMPPSTTRVEASMSAARVQPTNTVQMLSRR